MPAAAHFPDGIDGVIQEKAVVADDQHGALPFAQGVFQPLHRLDIQVVGGLVQHEQVGFFEQQARQQGAGLLPAAEMVERHVPVFLAQAQAFQGLLDAHVHSHSRRPVRKPPAGGRIHPAARPRYSPPDMRASRLCRSACWSCRPAKTVSISA